MHVAQPRRASLGWVVASPWRVACGLLALVVCAGLTGLHAQTQTFRAGVDVVRIEAIAVDAQGLPIRGLKPEDFTVLENGAPRQIVGFDAIDLPIDRISEPGEAPWVRSAPRDVVTNRVEERRLFLIVIDDAMMPPSERLVARAKRIARDVVSRLDANDHASVVFTKYGQRSQPFTADHALLHAAIDTMTFGMIAPDLGLERPSLASSRVLANAVESLILAPQLRKTLIFISTGPNFRPETLAPALSTLKGPNPFSQNDVATRLLLDLQRLFLAAARAHVNVYSFDASDVVTNLNTPGRDYLRLVAANTGGRATIANDDWTRAVTQMFQESSVYYLIGFTSASGASRGDRVEIRTTYPGAKVVSRKAFEVAVPTTASAPSPSPLAVPLASLLPMSSLPLRVAATVLPGATQREATVALVIGISPPADFPEGLSGTPEPLTIQVEAYLMDGKLTGTSTIDLPVVLRPAEAPDRAQYEVLAKLPVGPGRYQLRVAAHLARAKVSGSAFVDLDVPDFTRKGLTVAPLVLSTSPAPTAAPANAFGGLLPVVPTSHRSFGASDTVSVLARLVQGGKAPLVPMAVATTIVDTKNQRVFEHRETITPNARAERRATDYTFALPIETLAVGDYLLTVKASTPDGTNERTLRFSRR